ncbi:methyl-accepting chemotaxis protein [Vibrio sp. HN007]|uniref:methyl-accepting chemotaxis protein n=1 Tax=Vibrio iocasae TaxID=3098914 RepID=UPI0035D4CDD1
MDVVALSQKQKILLFLGLLCIGFAALAGFTTVSLNSLGAQYSKSNHVINGAQNIVNTQIRLLQLTTTLPDLSSDKVSGIKSELDSINLQVSENTQFLNQQSLSSQANELDSSISNYSSALIPWLELRSQLGFNADDGKLGMLKVLAATIEQKIAETGMVTLNSDFQALIKAQQNYLLTPNEQNLKLFNRALAGFTNMSNTYAMLELYEKELEQFKETFLQVADLSSQLGDIELQLAQHQEQVLYVVSDISNQLESMSRGYQESASDSVNITKWSVLTACIVLAIFTIASFSVLSLSMTRSLKQIAEVLKRVSSGDLSSRVKISSNQKDEFNQLGISINTTCENLSNLVEQVQAKSDELSDNAQALNGGLDSMANSQSEITNQTQIIASTTEQVNVTAQQVSDSLELVSEVSRSSMQSAEEGGKIITLAIGSLEEVGDILNNAAGHIQQLEEASQKVDSVMEIITGIAEQTNLLALNAAIEAARAGEQGRGFAVVADEVRSLAVRTVEAVDEISGTIETMKHESGEVIQYIASSKDSMEQGKQRGDDAVTALDEITHKAGEASEQTSVIAASISELVKASQSMTESMTQISGAMSELESNNVRLRENSQLVDASSSSLTQDCRQFTI